jgi:hypothetical protein
MNRTTVCILRRGDVVLMLTKAEARGLYTLADEGAAGLLLDAAAARAYIGTNAQVAAASRAIEALDAAQKGLTMATITLHYDVPPKAVARVRALLDKERLTNPNWSGSEFIIERGEATCIDATDEIAGAQLLSRVFAAIDGEDEPSYDDLTLEDLAGDLIAELFFDLDKATNPTDRANIGWQLHGAANMGYTLRVLTMERWEEIDDMVERELKGKP